MYLSGDEMKETANQSTSQQLCSSLLVDIAEHQWPIVYSSEYNMALGGIEKLHSFDTTKWGRIFLFLKEARMINDEDIIQPHEAQDEDLTLVHSQAYLKNLRLSSKVLGFEFSLLPEFLVLNRVLRSFRFQTGGTVLALRLAIDRGWAINIGGGFHHCCATRGGGFCPYADVTLAIRFLFETIAKMKKVMIIDLSAHQGNGLGRDFLNDERVYIFDAYNRDVYPHDGFAKRGIRCKVELRSKMADTEYLHLIRRGLDKALGQFEPDLVVYIAGTDVLEGDLAGCLSISPEGLIERDQLVFIKVRSLGIPIAMVSGGGYHSTSARVMADSILNLENVGLISSLQMKKAKSTLLLPKPIFVKSDASSHEILASHQEGRLDGFWDRFRSLTLGNLKTSSSSSSQAAATKDRRISLNIDGSLLRSITRSVSSSIVDKLMYQETS